MPSLMLTLVCAAAVAAAKSKKDKDSENGFIFMHFFVAAKLLQFFELRKK